MRKWIATALVVSLLAATSGMADDQAPASPAPRHRGPLALQITGGVLAGLGAAVAVSASRSDDMGSDVAATMGLIGMGLGAALFTGGTIWRASRERSAGRPETSLEINVLGPAPGLFAQASF